MFYKWTVADKDYQLKLTMRAMADLEETLGLNPMMLFGNGDKIPTTKELMSVIHASMVKYNHGIKLDEVYDIVDDWIDEGHTYTDLVPLIVDLYKASGLIPEKEDKEESPNVKGEKKN